jgi:hypothetical protein
LNFPIVDFEANGDQPEGEIIEVGWVDVREGLCSSGRKFC